MDKRYIADVAKAVQVAIGKPDHISGGKRLGTFVTFALLLALTLFTSVLTFASGRPRQKAKQR
jgi:hypothetical protein